MCMFSPPLEFTKYSLKNMRYMFSAKIELSMDHLFVFDGSPVSDEF